jgi:hypothetical protein
LAVGATRKDARGDAVAVAAAETVSEAAFSCTVDRGCLGWHDEGAGGESFHPNPRDMTKTQAISALILAEVASGKAIEQAFDAVIGEGAYQKLAGEVWEALQPA